MSGALRSISLGALVLCLLGRGVAGARAGHWEPPGIKPSDASLITAAELYTKTSGVTNPAYGQRIERYELSAGGEHVTAERRVRGADFLVRTTIAGGDFESGRAQGLRWRRTPNGLTRTISVDVQGDDLDRWPLADLPFDACDCKLAGEANVPKPAWVIEYATAYDVPHWFYIDEASGDLVRETWRDGANVVRLDFDDVRESDGVRRPYHWVVSGSGEPESVTLLSVRTAPVAAADVARPASDVTLFDGVPPGEVRLRASFLRGREAGLVTPGTLQGRPVDYVLDSGTSQILIDGALAHAAGIRTFLGHGIASELSLGSIHLQNVAIQTTNLGGFGTQAIVGYELFANRVVHVDYLHNVLGVRADVPDDVKATAWHVTANCDAGMPLVGAAVANEFGPRFALDTGSQLVVLLRYFWEHDGAEVDGLRPTGRLPLWPGSMHYLEGNIAVDASFGDVQLGSVKIVRQPVAVERTNAGDTIEAPLDGIIGANVLSVFEWWFDCPHQAVWFKAR